MQNALALTFLVLGIISSGSSPALVVRNKSFHSFFSRETERDLSIENRPIVTLWGRFSIGKSRPFDAEKCSKHFCYGLLVSDYANTSQYHGHLFHHSIALDLCNWTKLCSTSAPHRAVEADVNKLNRSAQNEYLYTRGFLLATKKPAFIPSHYRQADDSLWVDKSQLVTYSDDAQCCLIGFCVDIRSPESNPHTIANQLARALSLSERDFHRSGDYLCGRYVIVYRTKDGARRVVTDATGFRPVFHDAKATVVASHARLVATNLSNSPRVRPRRVAYYNEKDPSRSTQYPGVFQLNPNKSLELSTGHMERFFPYECRSSVSKQAMVDQLVDMVGSALKGLVRNQPKPILLSLTAGADSRTTLSIMVQNGIRPNRTFTYVKPGNGSSQDNEGAEQLCARLRLNHVCVDSRLNPIPGNLFVAFRENCQFRFVDLPDQIVSNMTLRFQKDRYVHVCSHVTEIWRWFNGQSDCQQSRVAEFRYKASQIGLDREELFGWSPASMVYWENRMNRWLTDCWVFTDVVFETFNPYNCRKIISLMLSTPSDFQSTQEIHDLLIDRLHTERFG
jgi:hypothetical protein